MCTVTTVRSVNRPPGVHVTSQRTALLSEAVNVYSACAAYVCCRLFGWTTIQRSLGRADHCFEVVISGVHGVCVVCVWCMVCVCVCVCDVWCVRTTHKTKDPLCMHERLCRSSDPAIPNPTAIFVICKIIN